MRCERLRTTRFAGAVALAASAALAAACGGSNSTSTVTAPTGTLVVETFTGTVPPFGTDASHTFTVLVGGAVNVTLTQAGPPATILVNMGVGTPGAGGACSIAPGGGVQAQAGITAQLSGTIAAGTYCLAVQEFQGIGTITYTVTVAHT